MAEKRTALRPIGAWLVIGGAMMLLSSFLVFLVQFKLGVILGIPAFIVYVLVASSEFSSGRSIWRAELGSHRSIMTTMALAVLARTGLLLLDPNYDIVTNGGTVQFSLGNFLFYTNVVLVVGELCILIYLSRHSEFFMSSLYVEKRRLETAVVRPVSECPVCHEVVESEWQSCPYCGTALPRVCVECGHDLGDMLSKCPHCGKEVMQSLALKKTIDSFQALAKEDALPETKATRYARLAEALLKIGDTEEAVKAYRQAIEHTRFNRKRTNFMVRMARILKNTGNKEEALSVLDQALVMDPQDNADAGKLKREIQASG